MFCSSSILRDLILLCGFKTRGFFFLNYYSLGGKGKHIAKGFCYCCSVSVCNKRLFFFFSFSITRTESNNIIWRNERFRKTNLGSDEKPNLRHSHTAATTLTFPQAYGMAHPHGFPHLLGLHSQARFHIKRVQPRPILRPPPLFLFILPNQ